MLVVALSSGVLVDMVGGPVLGSLFKASEMVIQSASEPEQTGVAAASVQRGASVGQTCVSVGATLPALTHGLKPLQIWPTSQQPPSLSQ